MKLTILGSGYVGLVSGVCLAAKGHDVTCVDVRPDVVVALNSGKPQIHERGLPALLTGALAAGRFRATQDLSVALADSALVLIAVGTPSIEGRIDLRFVGEAVRQVGALIRDRTEFLAVVIKSTVIPGTTDTFVRGILENSSRRPLGEFGLGMNPEFLREGNAVEDFMQPDRIVFGHEDARTLSLLEELYDPWQCDKLSVNTRTAELIKYANNCLLATQISAVNEIANLASVLGGVDVMEVMRGVHLDRRWSPIQPNGTRVSPQILSYLIPGCGFGGSCFPKDVQALRTQGESVGLPMQMLNGVLAVNEAQPGQITGLLNRHFGNLAGKRVLLLGVAFKPDTDDVRESASRKIIADLLAAGAAVLAHDPLALANARAAWPELAADYVEDWQASLDTCDATVIATRWSGYESLASEPLKTRLRGKVLVDARRLLRPVDFPGTTYLTIGFSPFH